MYVYQLEIFIRLFLKDLYRGLNFQLIVCVQGSDLAPPSVLKIPRRFNQVFNELRKWGNVL